MDLSFTAWMKVGCLSEGPPVLSPRISPVLLCPLLAFWGSSLFHDFWHCFFDFLCYLYSYPHNCCVIASASVISLFMSLVTYQIPVHFIFCIVFVTPCNVKQLYYTVSKAISFVCYKKEDVICRLLYKHLHAHPPLCIYMWESILYISSQS